MTTLIFVQNHAKAGGGGLGRLGRSGGQQRHIPARPSRYYRKISYKVMPTYCYPETKLIEVRGGGGGRGDWITMGGGMGQHAPLSGRLKQHTQASQKTHYARR